jgi:hypothetical protein
MILLLVLVVSGVVGYVLLPGVAVGMVLNWVVGAMTGWA